MKLSRRRTFAALFIILWVVPNLHAQKPAAVDSSFEAEIDSAWSHIQEYDFSDSLQNKYANNFFTYFLSHKDTETGNSAVVSAFTMWGNTGAAAEVDRAIKKLDYDSDVWASILNGISNAYYNNGRDRSAYIDFLINLEKNVTHPKSKSRVLMELGDHHLEKENHDRAKNIFRKVVTMNADSFDVDKALGNLHEIESLAIGQQAPDFSATTVDGNLISMADLEGKLVILEFWATWCGPCKPEIPHLKNLQSEYSNENLQIVGIALDEDKERLKKFIQDKNMTWPQIQQQKKWEGKVAQSYNVTGIPRSYVINESGRIIAKDLRGKKLEVKISEMLK